MEKLYLINQVFYLHIQEYDEGGWDFTLYDKTTGKDIDGGRLDDTMPLDAAFDEIMSMYGVDAQDKKEIGDCEDLICQLQLNC